LSLQTRLTHARVHSRCTAVRSEHEGGSYFLPGASPRFRNLILRINNSVDGPAIEVPTGILTGTSDALRYHVNDVIRWINNTIVTKRKFVKRYNTGLAERHNFLFNQTGNLIPDTNAGRFSFRIPLSFIFNFCEDYDKVIFNSKHEISFTTQEDKFAITRDHDAADDADHDAGKINLEKIKLYNCCYNSVSDITCIANWCKKIKTFVIPPSLGTFL